MGLDIVELVMTVEQTFGIDIPDRDAERLRTVGDVYWYVREHTSSASVPNAVANQSVPSDELWERLLDVIERRRVSIERASLRRRVSSTIWAWTDRLRVRRARPQPYGALHSMRLWLELAR
jgi:hypothetical protein